MVLSYNDELESDIQGFKCAVLSTKMRHALYEIRANLRYQCKYVEHKTDEANDLAEDIYAMICDEIYSSGLSEILDE